MKKYILGSLSALALLLFVTAPSALAAEDCLGELCNTGGHSATVGTNRAKVSTASVTRCEKQVASLNKVLTDLEFFKNTYYVVPADLSKYPIKKGVISAIYTGPEKTRKGRTNYGIVQLRFDGAYGVLSAAHAKSSKNESRYQIYLDRLKAGNAKIAQAIAAQVAAIDAAKQAYGTGTYDCSSKAGQKAVTTQYKAKAAAVTKIKKGVPVVKQSTKDSRTAYQKLEALRK